MFSAGDEREDLLRHLDTSNSPPAPWAPGQRLVRAQETTDGTVDDIGVVPPKKIESWDLVQQTIACSRDVAARVMVFAALHRVNPTHKC